MVSRLPVLQLFFRIFLFQLGNMNNEITHIMKAISISLTLGFLIGHPIFGQNIEKTWSSFFDGSDVGLVGSGTLNPASLLLCDGCLDLDNDGSKDLLANNRQNQSLIVHYGNGRIQGYLKIPDIDGESLKFLGFHKIFDDTDGEETIQLKQLLFGERMGNMIIGILVGMVSDLNEEIIFFRPDIEDEVLLGLQDYDDDGLKEFLFYNKITSQLELWEGD